MTDLSLSSPQYVIRSMTTSDAYRDQKPIPRHIYLRSERFRARAFWSCMSDETATFSSPQAAEAHAQEHLPAGDGYQVVPLKDQHIPTYWEIVDMGHQSHVTFFKTVASPEALTTEASILGLSPGSWPMYLSTDLGDGTHFVRKAKKMAGDEIAYVRYAQERGVDLLVFNT